MRSKLAELATTPVSDIAAFKRIEPPKDWNLPGLQALFELLELAPGLAIEISQNKDGSISSLQDRIGSKVRRLVSSLQSTRDRIPFWGGYVLSEAEAEHYKTQLTTSKIFFESLQAYSTTGKLKNFRYSAEEVREQQTALDQLANIEKLQALVTELSPIATYLSKAEAVLPIDHEWNDQVKAARADLLQQLGSVQERSKSNFRSQVSQRLTELKNSYIRIYAGLYAKCRLTMAEDKRKALLMRDVRLDQLQAISTIDILPSAHLVEYRNKLASLKTQGNLSEKDLQADPVPNNSDFRPINEDLKVSASTKLSHIEDQLDSMVKNWTDTLLENLDDPTTKDSLGLLSASDRSPIDAFIKVSCLA